MERTTTARTDVAELRGLLDRLSDLEEAASQFDGHNEMACHAMGEATDAILEAAMAMDDCVVRTLGAIGMVLPEIAFAETEEERWDLMNSALAGVLRTLEHIEDLVGGSGQHQH